MAHLLDGVHFAHVVAAGELVDVALQVLLAHLMVDSVVAALEHAPEALYAVRVGHLADVLADGVLDRLMVF